MLVVRNIDSKTPGTWVNRKVYGRQIGICIRAWTADIAKTMRKKYITGYEMVPDPQTGRSVRQEIIDDDAFFDAMVDFIIEGFRGIGSTATEPWPIDLEHKKNIVSLPVDATEQPLWQWILERAKEQAYDLSVQEQELPKNSQTP